MLTADLARYPLPDFLQGKCTPTVYIKWLNNKADTLLKRDKKRKKLYAEGITDSVYKEKIHNAVLEGGERDPYTGEVLDWSLISTWDPVNHPADGYTKQFALMPTVDHITPDVLEFEICSWQTNECKSDLSPQEFVDFCKKVVQYKNG